MTPDLKELTRRLRETPPHVLKEREAAAAIDSLIAELNSKRKYMEELRGALVYHMEQTRPIQRSIDALAIDAAIVKEQS